MCNSLDASCLGYLYCTDATFATTPADTCGGIGSYCTEANLAGIADPTAQQIVYDALCGSGTSPLPRRSADVLDQATATPGRDSALPSSCSAKTAPRTLPLYVSPPPLPRLTRTQGCSSGLTCTTNVAAGTQTCQTTVVPSGAARARRNIHARRSHLCPASQTACSISNSGFECIDTQTSIEACGGCPDEGGVDCTLLPGFGSVACVYVAPPSSCSPLTPSSAPDAASNISFPPQPPSLAFVFLTRLNLPVIHLFHLECGGAVLSRSLYVP